ncbi:hypothetical protein QFZ96_008127 [Paraburkholderia youngii]
MHGPAQRAFPRAQAHKGDLLSCAVPRVAPHCAGNCLSRGRYAATIEDNDRLIGGRAVIAEVDADFRIGPDYYCAVRNGGLPSLGGCSNSRSFASLLLRSPSLVLTSSTRSPVGPAEQGICAISRQDPFEMGNRGVISKARIRAFTVCKPFVEVCHHPLDRLHLLRSARSWRSENMRDARAVVGAKPMPKGGSNAPCGLY